jgi:hypothetical protein
VYAVGHRPPSPLATAIAAVLACGPDAVLSHRSAAALWRILPRWHAPVDVTAPTKHRLKGIHVHRSRQIESTTHYGIRVTTPARTLVDLADVLNPRQLTRALNEAQVQRLVTPAELTTLLTRYPGRRTAQLTPQRGVTRSHLEDRFVRFLKRHQLPLPELNQRIQGHEVDAVYLLNEGFSTLRITDHRLKHDQAKEAERLKDILRSRSG